LLARKADANADARKRAHVTSWWAVCCGGHHLPAEFCSMVTIWFVKIECLLRP